MRLTLMNIDEHIALAAPLDIPEAVGFVQVYPIHREGVGAVGTGSKLLNHFHSNNNRFLAGA